MVAVRWSRNEAPGHARREERHRLRARPAGGVRRERENGSMGLVPSRVADLKDPEMLRDLLASSESHVVERKRAADVATLAKVVSAFANTNGG